MRDHNGECLTCDEQGPHAPDCTAFANMLSMLRTHNICIDPAFCAVVRQQAAFELEILMSWWKLEQATTCTCEGGPQGEGLVSIPHEPHCPLYRV